MPPDFETLNSPATPAEIRAGLSVAQIKVLRSMNIAPDVFMKSALKRLIDDPSADPTLAQVVLAAKVSGRNPEDVVTLSLDGGRPHLALRPGVRL